MIRKVGDKYVLFNKDGKKRLGEFPTKDKALLREKQIQYFKHVKGK
jgi:hypothetical protein